MKRILNVLFTLSILLISHTVAAAIAYDWTWVGSLSIGPTWENAGEQQTFYLTPQIVKTYTTRHGKHAIFDGDAFLGLHFLLPRSLHGEFGMFFALVDDARISGNIWDDADPLFNNYAYKYHVQHRAVGFKGKLLWDKWPCWLPWVSAGFGVSFNNAYGFENTPLIDEAIVNPKFHEHLKQSYMYTFGIGVQRVLNNDWQFGVGYEFANWGKSHLDRARGQTLHTGLKLNHFYTNGILFNLTYWSHS